MKPSFETVFSIKLPASPARVFAALTEPAQLGRWFAQHAEIEPRAGGAYRFWGPAALCAATRAEATQQLLAVEPNASLRYRWRLHGADSEVSYRLEDASQPKTAAASDAAASSAASAEKGEGASTKAESTEWLSPAAEVSSGQEVGTAPSDSGLVGPDGAACTLHINHAVFGELPFAAPRHALEDLWRLHTGNLMVFLLDDPNLVLPDFTRSTAEVIVSVEIAAPPAKVFRALTVPELMTRWLGTTAKVDLATGAYSYGFNYKVEGKPVDGGPTRILELVPDRKLVTDWPDWRGDPDKPKTHVTWELTPLPPDGRRTRLTLTHAGFAHPVDRSDYQQGWGYFVNGVRTVAEEEEAAEASAADAAKHDAAAGASVTARA